MSPVLSRVSGAQGGVINNSGFRRAYLNRGPVGIVSTVSRSLRFNSPDSPYLSRTASDGNLNKYTWSGWVKRSVLGTTQMIATTLLGDPTYGARDYILQFQNDDTVVVAFADGTYGATTVAKFRDTTAWYHFLVIVDTTIASPSSDRIKLYVNGTLASFTGDSTYPTQNYSFTSLNKSGATLYIGCDQYVNRRLFFNGYLAEVHYIDGQALTPSSFGFTDGNGVWQPSAYSGTYGTNGYKLNFADNSSTTSGSNTGIGKDTSGTGNYFNSASLSVTAGAGNDSLLDSPANGTQTDTGVGGEVAGSYCIWNRLARTAVTPIALANGSLDVAGTGSASYWSPVNGTLGMSSGKWYWEITGAGTLYCHIGIADRVPDDGTAERWPGRISTGYSYYNGDGTKYNNNTGSSYGESYDNTDIIGVAFDADNGKLWFSKNNTWQASGNPAAGTNAAFSSIPAGTYFPCISNFFTSATQSANFGQRPFSYSAPSGFKSLNTANLTSTTITTSGTFAGNASTDGPFVYLNGVPTAMTINGNAVTFGTDVDKLATGFKIRSSSSSYNNTSGSNSYSITSTGAATKNQARAQTNP